MSLDVVKYKENDQNHLHVYRILIQRKRRICKVTKHKKEAHSFANFLRNLKWKCIESILT